MRAEISELWTEIRAENSELRTEIRAELAQFREETGAFQRRMIQAHIGLIASLVVLLGLYVAAQI